MRRLLALAVLQLFPSLLLLCPTGVLCSLSASRIDPSLIGSRCSSTHTASPPLALCATAVSPCACPLRCVVGRCVACSPVVRTVYGSVVGYELSGVNHYLGLPFAAPPVGPLRFRQPTPPEPWPDTRPAYLHGSICPQIISGDLWLGDEDCLYLNVYSPSNVTAASRLPVLVWLYGGAFVFGDGYEFGLYSATNLINSHRSYIVVTLNYRLAALGFLALNSLRAASSTNSSGNVGIWDQIAAMEWVRDNIASFGGDPERVTLAGESAGAMSVCIHLASRHSRGLFSAAVMESGTCDSDTFFVSYEASVGWSEVFAHSVGCEGDDSEAMVECLQRLPVDKLVQPSKINTSTQSHTQRQATLIDASTAVPPSPFDLHLLPNSLKTVQLLYSHALSLSSLAASNSSVTPIPLPMLYPTIPWTPTIDSSLLLQTPLASIESGDWARVPLVIGTNKDEGTIFLSQLYSILPGQLHDPLIASDLPLILRHVFGNDSSLIQSVLDTYPTSAYPTVRNLTEVLLRDWFFACPSRRVAAAVTGDAAARGGSESGGSVWLYEFSYMGDWVEDGELGVYHSSELEFVFDNAWPPLVHSFSARDQRMADTVGAYWANLVVHRDVNVGERTEVTWERWTAADRKSVRLEVPAQAEKALHAAVCDFWDAAVAKRRNVTHHDSDRSTAHVTID